jgi:hypothetical protein
MQILNRSNYVMMKTIEITETITLYLIKTSKMVSFTKKLPTCHWSNFRDDRQSLHMYKGNRG